MWSTARFAATGDSSGVRSTTDGCRTVGTDRQERSNPTACTATVHERPPVMRAFNWAGENERTPHQSGSDGSVHPHHEGMNR